MRDFLKLASVSTFALSLMAAPAMAQEDNGFGDWDADASGAVDEQEWGEGFGENDEFGTWDENDDQALDEEEYESGVYSTYDEDESGDLSESEFREYEEDEDEWF